MAGHLTHCKKNSNKISLLSYEKVYSEYPIEENSETDSIIYPFETAIEDNLRKTKNTKTTLLHHFI